MQPRHLQTPRTLEAGEILVDPATGTVRLVVQGSPDWFSFTPLADGRPVLKGEKPLAAIRRTSSLALATLGGERRRGATLRVFSLEGKALSEHALRTDSSVFQLSHDGALVAVDAGSSRVAVSPVSGGAPRLVTTTGRFHNDIEVLLGDSWLAIEVPGKHVHLVQWGSEELLTYVLPQTALGQTLERRVASELSGLANVRPTGERAVRWQLPDWTLEDRSRFVKAARAELVAVVDRYGEVILFDRQGALKAMLFAWRKELAVWLPDGTRAGSAQLLAGGPSPDARRKVARALQGARAEVKT